MYFFWIYPDGEIRFYDVSNNLENHNFILSCMVTNLLTDPRVTGGLIELLTYSGIELTQVLNLLKYWTYSSIKLTQVLNLLKHWTYSSIELTQVLKGIYWFTHLLKYWRTLLDFVLKLLFWKVKQQNHLNQRNFQLGYKPSMFLIL